MQGNSMLRTVLISACCTVMPVIASGAEEPKQAVVGQPAANFTVTGIDGKEFQLSDKLAGEKNLVLMFSRAHW